MLTGELLSYIYGHTPSCVKKKIFFNGTLTRQICGATDLSLGLYMQLDSGRNMGWVPSGHTSSSWSVKQENAKIGTPDNTELGSYTYTPIYIYIYMYIYSRKSVIRTCWDQVVQISEVALMLLKLTQ